MRHRILQALDSIAHFLYCPGMVGHRVAVARGYHHIHLIPASLLKVVCDPYERSVWAGFDSSVDAEAGSWPNRVHADFNDIEPDGHIFVLSKHAERSLMADDFVLVHDCEGNSMWGTIAAVTEDGNARIDLLTGSWHSADEQPEPALRVYGYVCRHVRITTSQPGTLSNVASWCNCKMQPLYAA